MPEPTSHPVGVLHEIRWKEICPWLILVKALWVTLLLRVLALAMLGVVLTEWGESELRRWFPTEPEMSQRLAADETLVPFLQFPPELDQSLTEVPFRSRTSPLQRGWQWVAHPFRQLANQEISWHSSLALLLHGVWVILVWGLFGGAIARIAAIYLTRGETLGPRSALRDALTVWPATTGAPLIALLFAAALAVPIVLLGFLLRSNLMAIIAGLLWCFVLAWGLMLAGILVGLLLGWPLMWACLGVERSDAFDGVSRCYAYVYQRPLHMAFFVLLAMLLCYLGEAVVAYFAAATIAVAEWTLSWGMGSERTADLLSANWQASSSPLASRAINAWIWVWQSIRKAYPLACLWPMAVAVYLLLRREIDSSELDEVTLADDPAQTGLPTLTTGASGVPRSENQQGEEQQS